MFVNNSQLSQLVKDNTTENPHIEKLDVNNNNFIETIKNLQTKYDKGFLSYRFLQYNKSLTNNFAFSCCLAYFNKENYFTNFSYVLGNLDTTFFIENKFINNYEQLNNFLEQYNFENMDYRLNINYFENIEFYFYPVNYKNKTINEIKNNIKVYPEYNAFHYILTKKVQ